MNQVLVAEAGAQARVDIFERLVGRDDRGQPGRYSEVQQLI